MALRLASVSGNRIGNSRTDVVGREHRTAWCSGLGETTRGVADLVDDNDIVASRDVAEVTEQVLRTLVGERRKSAAFECDGHCVPLSVFRLRHTPDTKQPTPYRIGRGSAFGITASAEDYGDTLLPRHSNRAGQRRQRYNRQP